MELLYSSAIGNTENEWTLCCRSQPFDFIESLEHRNGHILERSFRTPRENKGSDTRLKHRFSLVLAPPNVLILSDQEPSLVSKLSEYRLVGRAARQNIVYVYHGKVQGSERLCNSVTDILVDEKHFVLGGR